MSVFAKLNLKDQDAMLVLDTPASFEAELRGLGGVVVHRTAGRLKGMDEDWSAVRFRRAEFIKTMTRGTEHALSATGRTKTRAAAKRRRG